MWTLIPPFEPSGELPPGLHAAEWEEFVARFGTTAHRSRLLQGLHRAIVELRRAGCRTVYIDGSFVTSKEVPGDYDACWEPDGVNPEILDPVLLTFDYRRAAQKTKYLGELFVATWPANDLGDFFIDFFQTSRDTGAAKGIVQIDLGRLP